MRLVNKLTISQSMFFLVTKEQLVQERQKQQANG